MASSQTTPAASVQGPAVKVAGQCGRFAKQVIQKAKKDKSSKPVMLQAQLEKPSKQVGLQAKKEKKKESCKQVMEKAKKEKSSKPVIKKTKKEKSSKPVILKAKKKEASKQAMKKAKQAVKKRPARVAAFPINPWIGEEAPNIYTFEEFQRHKHMADFMLRRFFPIVATPAWQRFVQRSRDEGISFTEAAQMREWNAQWGIVYP